MTRHWESGVSYNVGEVLEYQGQDYKVIQGHTSQSDWIPGVGTAALYEHLSSSGHCEPPQQHHESHHEPHHEPRHEHPQAPAQNLNPLHSLQDALTSKFSSFGGRDEWLRDAQDRTERFHQDGPRAPTTWVFVSGRDIPSGALVAGLEHNNTLYIARGYVEDGLYVGKAGKHLGQGAEIGRQNKSYALHEYEILLGNPHAVRWVEVRGVPNPENFGARHVDAGVDAHGHQIFIAQVSHNGGVHPARASSGESGAYLAYGNGELAFQEYTVLCYA